MKIKIILSSVVVCVPGQRYLSHPPDPFHGPQRLPDTQRGHSRKQFGACAPKPLALLGASASRTGRLVSHYSVSDDELPGRGNSLQIVILFVLFRINLGFFKQFWGWCEVGHVCYVEWWWNYAEIWSGGWFMVVLGCWKHLLLITNVFKRNDLVSLPQNFIKSPSRPYFGILAKPIDMKKLAQSNATLRIARIPWNSV